MTEQQSATYGHHWHSEDDCCVCADNPCGAVSVRFVLDHENGQSLALAAAWEREIEYVLAHGHRSPDLFAGEQSCPPSCPVEAVPDER